MFQLCTLNDCKIVKPNYYVINFHALIVVTERLNMTLVFARIHIIIIIIVLFTQSNQPCSGSRQIKYILSAKRSNIFVQ
jgi:hypothetical protein